MDFSNLFGGFLNTDPGAASLSNPYPLYNNSTGNGTGNDSAFSGFLNSLAGLASSAAPIVNAVTGAPATSTSPATAAAVAASKSNVWLYVAIGVVAVVIGFVLFRRPRR